MRLDTNRQPGRLRIASPDSGYGSPCCRDSDFAVAPIPKPSEEANIKLMRVQGSDISAQTGASRKVVPFDAAC